MKNTVDLLTSDGKFMPKLEDSIQYFCLMGAQSITTTKTTVSSYQNRTIPGYCLYVFEVAVANSVRATIVLNPGSVYLKNNSTYTPALSVELAWVDSAKTQRWVSIQFVDSTHWSIYGSSNLQGNTYASVFGYLKLPA